MKKAVLRILLVLTWMLALTVAVICIGSLLQGCGYNAADFQRGAVVTEIQRRKLSMFQSGAAEGTTVCFYFTNKRLGQRISEEAYFCGPCGKFNIGDTLYLTKSKP